MHGERYRTAFSRLWTVRRCDTWSFGGIDLHCRVFNIIKCVRVYGLASAQAVSDLLTFIVALLMTAALFRRIKKMEYEHNMLKTECQPDNMQPPIEHEEAISI